MVAWHGPCWHMTRRASILSPLYGPRLVTAVETCLVFVRLRRCTHERRTDRRRRVVQAKVLLLSERRIADLVAYCVAYEFEDTFAAVTGAQRIDATDLSALEFSRRVYKLARLASGSPSLARRLAPYPRSKVLLENDFELFFPVFSHTYELYSLAAIPNWRRRCRKAACYINEVWSDMLPD